MKHISKAERRKQAMVKQAREESAGQALQFSRKRFKKFDEVINAVYEGEDLSAFFADRRIARLADVFKKLSSEKQKKQRSFLRQVLVHFSNKTALLSGPDHIQAISNMTDYHRYWKRDLYMWKPATRQKTTQIKELAEYLFCLYPAPAFLFKAFFEEKEQRFINWFIMLGAGASVKDIEDIPVPLTQRMRHFFTVAPEKFSIAEALRWAQVKGMGGNDWLANRIAFSWLSSKPFGDEEFWAAFVGILIRAGLFDQEVITQMIDYVREMKRTNKEYSLKGRTFISLHRQSNIWHRRFSMDKPNFFWVPCGIDGMRIVKGEEEVRMEELTEYRFMVDEGRQMKHCVASYSYYCANGRTAVFSLRKYLGGELLERLATIEVSLHNMRIVQAKAKMNRPISEEARKYMMIWKEKAGLVVGQYV